MTEIQIDKIKGVFFGQAIGDALGLGTEFLTKDEIKGLYLTPISTYSQIIQDKHRSRWEKGDWTDDTEQFLCICDSILKRNEVSEHAFAEELHTWYSGNPLGIGYTVLNVVKTPQFTLSPHKAAEMYWKMKKGKVASNGGIMRTSITGIFDFWDNESIIKNTEKICKVTHFDPRCVGSSVVVASIISELISSQKELSKDELIDIGNRYAPEIEESIKNSFYSEIGSLHLDETVSLGYTLKALSAGLWAYFHANSFESGILSVIHEGGDADTNASVAGSLLGAKFGYSKIPQYLIDGVLRKEYLEEKCNSFLACLQHRRSNSKI
jgi:ADP-ribosylglycohydrolase